MKPYSITRIITVFSLLLISIPSYADQWYHVEFIVFEQLDALTDEQWPVMPDNELSATLTPGMASSLIQPAHNNRLNTIATRLSRSSHYRVHYHQAWQQPIMRKGHAKAVKITSTDGLIAGSIRLDKATYLHASLDLWLNQNPVQVNSWSDVSPDGTDISELRNPHLKESRRIRSKKRYFFDHPKMGAILELTPIETPAAVQVNSPPLETFSLPSEASPTASE